MQKPTDATVLGDFAGARLEHFGVVTTFSRSDDKFLVHTENGSGGSQDYEIAYTFGVYPLQQYLIAFPLGRLQALGIAWDSRPKDQGGQRWFPLYPDQKLSGGDPLHWTGRDQTWNYMCANCHSTNLQKNYDLFEQYLCDDMVRCGCLLRDPSRPWLRAYRLGEVAFRRRFRAGPDGPRGVAKGD